MRKRSQSTNDPHSDKDPIPTATKIIRSTLAVLGSSGVDGLTTKSISEESKLSTGIIHHYFDTKDNLIYASYVFLIRNLQQRTLKALQKEDDLQKKLWKIVKIHFGDIQLSKEATSVWPHFWSHAIHDKRAARLLYIYSRRLLSNFTSIFKQMGQPQDKAKMHAQQLLFIIHGAWIEHRVCRLVKDKETLYQTLRSYIQDITGEQHE